MMLSQRSLVMHHAGKVTQSDVNVKNRGQQQWVVGIWDFLFINNCVLLNLNPWCFYIFCKSLKILKTVLD